MLPSVMTGIYNRLAGHSPLISLLTTYEDQPAIFQGKAPDGATMPYLVIKSETANPEETDATERMILVCDVWTRGESASPAMAIGSAAEKALMVLPNAEGITMIGVFRQSRGMVPDDDPDIQHLNSRTIVRYGRNDLYFRQ